MIEQEFERGRRQAAPVRHHRRGSSSRSSSTAPTTRWRAGSRPALDQEVIWCQLFSEPDAGSDAAGIKTKATRVDGGWLVNGQKVWTSGAHVRGHGLRHRAHQPRRAEARGHHDDGHRHARATGVEVRPLKMTTRQLRVQRGLLQRRVRARRRRGRPGRRRLDGRPRHARQREREHRRRRRAACRCRASTLVAPFDAHPERLDRRRRAASAATSPSTRRWAC